MNIKPIAILASCVLFTAGCNKSPTSPTANNSGNQPPPVQAEAFHGQVYKSVEGRNVVTLTSKDECELTQNGTTLLCKYTKQTDALRVIATVVGTPQVLYFRFVDQGLQANDGQILLAPQQYADAIAKIRQEEEKRQREEQEKQRMAEKIAQEAAKCTEETETYHSIPLYLQPFTGLTIDGYMIISDVAIKLNLINHFSGGGRRNC